MAKKLKKPVTPSKIKKRKLTHKGPIMRMTVRSAAAPTPPVRERSGAAVTFSSDQLQKVRDILTQKREDLLAVVQRKKEEEIEDLGVGDEADVAMHSVEKEMLFELSDSEKQTLDMVEDALIKMDRKTYGSCESCQRVIPRFRLQVVPWARYCVNCQNEQEAPVSE